jgi:GNAT superfamily N-acetyltransferase
MRNSIDPLSTERNRENLRILEYNAVDPLQVLNLMMLALDFPFTPEYVAHIRQTDPRPFPCFTVNAVDTARDLVVGQVGVFRLPMISTKGREEVGGVWALSTHPEHAGREVASCLLEEAHTRMRAAGLRFSTLGTDRYREAYKLYQRHGYVDMNIWGTAVARWETAHQPTRLRAERVQPPGPEGYDFVERVFETVGSGYLGFAWRHTPFARLREQVPLEDIWVLWENNQPVGYIFAQKENLMLKVNVHVLRPDIDAIEAIAAVASHIRATYIRVNMSRPSDIASLQQAGFRVAHPNGAAFMVKPLDPGVTIEEARRLFGIGTDRFLISWLDTT